ncbi:MAG: hypothetical protein BM557_08560 [Flavobacterium sp. MedPE-SWcel]|uniref:hypothetical protein n=1 Tax=uncultured Flavobacterium sp. TaxID=165435 RepID=UPI0009201932|nr:hypothetical protein [uncultured Flavobacterium sp.]OIQ17255.1 MAG: hypothetical protein BM557_08560 [Flavobacterium sp. MedPE-SWcel]
MKTKLLLALTAFFFISCSSDDTTSVDNDNPDTLNPVVEKHIKDITNYSPDSEGVMQYVTFKKFENGLPLEEYIGPVENPSITILYTYDTDNKLTVMNWESSTAIVEITFEYDVLGRLTSKHMDVQNNGGLSGTIEHTDFTYEVDNQIFVATTKTVFGTHNSNTTYEEEIKYLDNEGYVYKISDTSENPTFREAIVENGNLISIQSSVYDESIGEYVISQGGERVYDMFNEVRGEYNFTNVISNQVIALETNVFGSNKANASLHNGGVSDRMVNYLIERKNSSGELLGTRVYEFDDDGYPIKSQRVDSNGDVFSENHITYYE